MSRKSARKSPKREMLWREGPVTDWDLQMIVHAFNAEGGRTRRADTYLVLEGEFTEPVKGVAKFSIQLHPEKEPQAGRAEIPSVGSFLSTKPHLSAAASLSQEEYETVLALATTGHLRHLSCSFQALRYGSGLISSLGFFSKPPSDADK